MCNIKISVMAIDNIEHKVGHVLLSYIRIPIQTKPS